MFSDIIFLDAATVIGAISRVDFNWGGIISVVTRRTRVVESKKKKKKVRLAYYCPLTPICQTDTRSRQKLLRGKQRTSEGR